MQVVYLGAYGDLVRFKVKWETSYGKGGPNAPVDVDLDTFFSGLTEPPPTLSKSAQ